MSPLWVTITRWVARLSTIPLLFYEGAFFFEHLEWFVNPIRLPPVRIFLLMGCHFALLIGLVTGWRWEKIGGWVVIITAAIFFMETAREQFLQNFAPTVFPGFLWIICGHFSSKSMSTPIIP